MSISPYPRIGTLWSPANTKSPSGAVLKSIKRAISLNIWIVVPESRMAEFLSGYWAMDRAV